MKETVDYLIEFMLGDDVSENSTRFIGYTSDKSKFMIIKLL
jgi:hypothetical protein